jgi:hypothetical protein
MNKKHKIIGLATAVLTLAFGIAYPYVGLAETTGQVKQQTEQQSEGGDTEAAAAETKDTSQTAAPSLTLQSGSSLYPVSATKKFAENSRLELYLDPKTANIRLVNKQSGKEWLGAPQVSRRTLPNNKKFMDSPVHVEYTEGADITQTYTLKTDLKTKLKVTEIDQGARAEFELTAVKISFAVEYRLREDGVEVTVPYDSIKEAGTARLTSLEVLPFFNAGSETDKGAILVPDGSGALMVFRKDHPKYFSGYSEPVYGPDAAFKTEQYTEIYPVFRKSKAPKEYIAMPVFGDYRNGTGFLGIITKGDKDALINGTPAGIRNIPYYRTAAEFVYRKMDVIFIGTSGQIPLFQSKKIEGDRQVRYVMLEDEEADYVGMAKAYRSYLVNEKGVKPVKQEGTPLNVQLLGGVLRDEIIGTTFIEMTTFEQARSIIDAYAEKGVKNLEITFTGWSKDGLYGNQPDHFPVETHLGGAKDLKELVGYAKEKGVSIYLQANYVRPFNSSDGYTKKKDAVRGIDREVMDSYNTWVSDNWINRRELFHLMKPERVLDNRIKKELDDFADLGVTGVSLQYMGNTIYSDLDPKSPATREQTAGAWVEALDSLKEKVGKTAVDYGFAYTLGHVDRIDNAPMDSSHFVYTDQTVPFYQIVLHGLVPYVAKPTNLRDDSETEFLRAVEYGALPSYELTYEPPSKLQRTMEDRLFSSDYSYWLDPSTEEYRKFAELHEKTAGQEIVNHERLSAQVYRTTYANGTQVVVNYGAEAATVDGLTVSALDYAVTGGGQ